jgi:hypothetical protein
LPSGWRCASSGCILLIVFIVLNGILIRIDEIVIQIIIGTVALTLAV